MGVFLQVSRHVEMPRRCARRLTQLRAITAPRGPTAARRVKSSTPVLQVNSLWLEALFLTAVEQFKNCKTIGYQRDLLHVTKKLFWVNMFRPKTNAVSYKPFVLKLMSTSEITSFAYTRTTSKFEQLELRL